jgi:site-specific DNA-methyltransferase (adenine-specific)
MNCYRCEADPCSCKDGITLFHGDCREVLPLIEPVGRCVTDPPYGLEFMGKGWDHGVPGVEFWETISEALLPGAMCLAFGGTRTFHRLAVAIEDVGFEIRDTIMWVYGSGFPKSLDISKAIDKAAGAEREVVGKYVHPTLGADWVDYPSTTGDKQTQVAYGDYAANQRNITAPATDAAKQWQGWGTSLKPAWEPVIVAMKPLAGTFAENAITHGVAGINVDGGRIAGGVGRNWAECVGQGNTDGADGTRAYGKGVGGKITPPHTQGRYPANLIHDGSEEVLGLFPESKDGVAGARTGVKGVCYGGHGAQPNHKHGYGGSGSAARFFKSCPQDPAKEDLLLDRAKAILRELQTQRSQQWKTEIANTVDDHSDLPRELAASVLSDAVTSASQGGIQLSGLLGLSTNVTPILLRLLCESVIVLTLCIESESLPVSCHIATVMSSDNLAKFAALQKQIDTTTTTTSPMSLDGSAVVVTLSTTQNNTARGAKDSKPSRLFYCAKSSKADRGYLPEESLPLFGETLPEFRNTHPTVKPVELMKYLLTLTAMPTDMGLVDPFAGSGTTGVAAKALGHRCILIEQEAAYCDIIKTRLGD